MKTLMFVAGLTFVYFCAWSHRANVYSRSNFVGFATVRPLDQTTRKNHFSPVANVSSRSNPVYQNLTEHVVLQKPSTGDYELSNPHKTYYSQWDQDRKLWEQFLCKIDGLKKGGYKPFFLESGAYNGERDSNSLFLEREHGWSGLLVEPSSHYQTLRFKRRKAWSFHGALSPTGNSGVAVFDDLQDGPLSHLDVGGLVPIGRTIRVTGCER